MGFGIEGLGFGVGDFFKGAGPELSVKCFFLQGSPRFGFRVQGEGFYWFLGSSLRVGVGGDGITLNSKTLNPWRIVLWFDCGEGLAQDVLLGFWVSIGRSGQAPCG